MSETRKLAAILAADVVGFSRMAGLDEDRTLARLRSLRSDLIDPTIAVHNGRVVKRMGDGVLVEFRSVVDAVRCAIEWQNSMVERNAGVPEEWRIAFRIGIHLGDVVEEFDGDLMGDGVNIAARLEGVAKPGAICLSEDAYRQVRARLDLAVMDLGQTQLKNISHSVRVFSLQVGVAAVRIAEPAPARLKSFTNRRAVLGWGAFAAAIFAILAAWVYSIPRKPALAFDALKIPFISDERRLKAQAEYSAAPAPKALAIAFDAVGMATGASSETEAQRLAMEDCQSRSHRTCMSYAVGDRLVWARKPPPALLPVDLSLEPTTQPLDFNALPMFSQQQVRGSMSDYLIANDPAKTLAWGKDGAFVWTVRGGAVSSSARMSLEKCAFNTGSACLLIARGNYLTQPLPTMREVTGPFLFSSDTQIASPDRERLEDIYAGGHWRAIAKGERGTWAAVADKPSEADAIDSALKLCAQGGDSCAIYAIGNFRVALK